MLYTIENDELICSVDTHGCELKGVRDKDSGKEYMWDADPGYWGRTSPVLFPFVGSLKDKRYRYKGVEYEMTQHGFARDMEFTLTENTGKEIWMELGENEETLKKYPFRFSLKIGYRLEGRKLFVMWKVSNRNDGDMYFAIGAHPGFMKPDGRSSSFKLCDKEGKPVSSIKNRLFGSGGCATDSFETIDTPDGILNITEHLFDGDALIIEDEQLGSVGLMGDSPDKAIITVSFDAPLVGLWSPPHKNAPFVCIEPWYGRCDTEGFSGELPERGYEQKLGSGEEFNAEYTMLF